MGEYFGDEYSESEPVKKPRSRSKSPRKRNLGPRANKLR